MRLKQIQMLLRLTLSSNSFYFLLTQHNKKEQKKSHTKRRFKKKESVSRVNVPQEQTFGQSFSYPSGYLLELQMAQQLALDLAFALTRHKL